MDLVSRKGLPCGQMSSAPVSTPPCTEYGAQTLYRAMLNDPRVFPGPECFMPERYLVHSKEDGQGDVWTLRTLAREEDPVQIAFGFGRRCAFFSASLA